MRMPTTVIALTLVVAGLLAMAKPAQAGNTIYGYVAVADVRVPGGQLMKITVTGGLMTAAGPDFALNLARQVATARLSQYGNIVTGPVTNLTSPFVGTTTKMEPIR
jgi:hypothetical protein